MKLYGDPASSNTRRVLATAVHIGIKLDLQLINLFVKENRTPEFLNLNPNGTIPTFVDGNVILYEASAIMIYLAEKFKSDLFPSGNDRYETLKWMFWAAEHFRYGSSILIEERFLKKSHGLPEEPWAVDFAEHSIRKYAKILDAHLKNRCFVVTDQVTLADFDLAAPFSHLTRTRAPFDEFPHLRKWHQRLLDEVPAWQLTNENLNIRMDEIRTVTGISFD